MSVRMAIAAGRFYSADREECLKDLYNLIFGNDSEIPDLPDTISAGIVPHAGWVFSGDLCGMFFKALKSKQDVDTFILFGANHSVNSHNHMIYRDGSWATPLGNIDIDYDLASELLDKADGLLLNNYQGHSNEHSLEVIVPFIQYQFPDAKIVPIMVQPIESASQIGTITAEVVSGLKKCNTVAIGSTDLTHYGPSYYNTNMGTGREALQWAKNTNDRYMIDLVCSMKYDQVVNVAETYKNACGAGAIAATTKFALDRGSSKGILLKQTCSSEVYENKFGRSDINSVGYASIVF